MMFILFKVQTTIRILKYTWFIIIFNHWVPRGDECNAYLSVLISPIYAIYVIYSTIKHSMFCCCNQTKGRALTFQTSSKEKREQEKMSVVQTRLTVSFKG